MNSRNKGTLIINGLLGNLVIFQCNSNFHAPTEGLSISLSWLVARVQGRRQGAGSRGYTVGASNSFLKRHTFVSFVASFMSHLRLHSDSFGI